MKYIAIGWPEIQDYMNNPEYPEKCYFDPDKNIWLIPEDWEPDDLGFWCIPDTWESDDLGLDGNIGDLEDAMG